VPSSDHGDQSAIEAHSDPTVIKETTQGIDPDFSPDISERAKMRTRKATKRSSQYAEEVIDITNDDLTMTPARKPKGRPKARPVRLATPVGNNPRLNSDSVTVPMLSSSPLLPPSDPFPASTVINSTPPRPGPLDEVAAPDSTPQGSPIRSKKRKSTSRPRSPKAGKYRKKAVVEVVITSPRKTKSMKVKALEGKGSESRNDHPPSSPSPAELRLGPVEGEDVHASLRLRSGSDDELILAPKRQSSSKKVKSRKGKQKTREPRSVDGDALSEIDPSSERVAEGEEPRNDEHPAEGTSTRSNEDHKSRSCPAEPGSPTPLLVGLVTFSIIPNADLIQKKPKLNVSAREDNSLKPSVTRETPTPGKLRYSLSQFDRKTPMKTPMRELIRRAASHPSAPFSISSSPIASPLAKTSKSMLRHIAPLHPTRRSPPPPLPRPPPPKKSKKMLDLEEKWELELEDEVEGWWALTDGERLDWRRAKRDKELGFDD
jgi:hypothetical protein